MPGGGVDGVEHRDVDDRERLGLAAGAELLAEDPRVAAVAGAWWIEARGSPSRSRSSAGGGARVVADRLVGEARRRGVRNWAPAFTPNASVVDLSTLRLCECARGAAPKAETRAVATHAGL
jgi:hypothetical protein